MAWNPIHKVECRGPVKPNLFNYEETQRTFSWDSLVQELQRSRQTTPQKAVLNIAEVTIDRHAEGRQANQTALRFIDQNWTIKNLTYQDLKEQTNCFANVLKDLGICQQERIFALAGRIPALYIAALGSLKYGGVFCPLFAAFGPEPIAQRMERGDAKVLVTTQALYTQKIAALRDRLPNLHHILLVDVADHISPGLWSLPQLMAAASSTFAIAPTTPEDMALLHFTSGTTGTPKGAIHVHQAVYQHYMTAKYVLDLHPDDIFWCTADPGWVTGTSYGIIAPLTLGITCIVDEAEFDANRWYHILEQQSVSVWYTAPTAIRRLMRMNQNPRVEYDLSRLRLIHSVGDPLNPEAITWSMEKLGLPIHDNWWQTETGGIMVANYLAMDIRPGSMGRPVPGVSAAIVQKLDHDTLRFIDKPGVTGELALHAGWPSMFRGYLHDEARYRQCFIGDWYLTGDLATRDADGYFWFVGREDDMIKMSGHQVGPFEVESVLMEHPAVAEVGVVGIPNPLIGELVKAFVALKPDYQPSEVLRLELIGFARQKLGVAIAPKELEFQPSLPKTRSGKIMRRLLKARELGLPEGDLSTLESD